MKIFLALIFFFVVSSHINAQNYSKAELDSLYEKFIELRNNRADQNSYKPLTQTDFADRKCGFGIVSDVVHNLKNFTIDQQSILTKILQLSSKVF